MQQPSRAVALYGTEEEVPAPRILRAGALTAELEAGNLRYVRWRGEEVLRAVSFIVRDEDWGTYAPTISDLDVREEDGAFHVRLHAVAGTDETFAYDATIEGRADGTLTFEGRGGSPTGFSTIRHADGREVEGGFPEIIDPVQPMMDLRALAHRTPGGSRVVVVMEGDTYEMEDQRNWTDASYKTYVRPLARPWPYRIAPGETVDQRITVRISGEGPVPVASGTAELRAGERIGTVPHVGIGLRPEDVEGTRDVMDALRDLGPRHVIVHHDPRAGHDAGTLTAMVEIARDVGAAPWLEAVVARPDDAGAATEVAALGRMAREMGDPFGTVLVSPAPDLKCTLPGSAWPDAPDAAALFDAARAAFPGARIGGGMFSYFTELNRKRPPVDWLDLMSFTTSPTVHAGDDRSVMETREAHGAVAASAAAIAAGTPWAVGPSAIGVRDNPYGEAAKDNPGNLRQAMNRNDPRQRGLIGAAWALGYVADFAAGGAFAVALGAPTGPFGAIAAPTGDPQPWFDEAGGVYPVFHVLRGLARLAGAKLLGLDLPAPGPFCGLAARRGGGTETWIANTGPAPVEATIEAGAMIAVLDAAAFAEAAGSPDHMDRLKAAGGGGPLRLDGFAVARIVTGD